MIATCVCRPSGSVAGIAAHHRIGREPDPAPAAGSTPAAAAVHDPWTMETALESSAEETDPATGVAVSLRGLRRDYNDRPVLRDVSLELGRRARR